MILGPETKRPSSVLRTALLTFERRVTGESVVQRLIETETIENQAGDQARNRWERNPSQVHGLNEIFVVCPSPLLIWQ
jgi:hypothetical protein